MSELSVGSLSGLAANSYVIDVAAGSQLTQPGMLLQVVSTTKTDVFSMSSTTFASITGLSATITPSSASSKILILAIIFGDHTSASSYSPHIQLLRDSTAISIGDAAGSRIQMTTTVGTLPQGRSGTGGANFLDSPATTSAITYGFQIRAPQGTAYINRTTPDTDGTNFGRGVSTITLMEIAG